MNRIETIGIDGLPGSRHGVAGPTALVRLRWRGERPQGQELDRLQERLAHALWVQERLDWKDSEYGNWRDLDGAFPRRSFPEDFLVEPAPERLSGLLAAGLTALQWGSLVPVASARVLGDDGQEILLAVPYRLPQPLQAALTLLGRIVSELAGALSEPSDADAEGSDWRQALEQELLATSGQAALDVDGFHMALDARRRGLPLTRLDFGVVEIGHGVSRRRFLGSLQQAEAVASVLASNKLAIKRQLLRAGIPVPAHRVVQTEEEALAAAAALGWPVVLKPIDQSLGHGVTANIWRGADLLRAYRKARGFSRKPLLLERHVPGHDHRILVIDGQVAVAVCRQSVAVRGDGFQSLRQLIERARAACTDPEEAARYGQDRESRRLIDDQGLSLDDVVESGRMVSLRRRMGSGSASGPWVDVTERLHPEVTQLAVRTATVLGVRLAGIDVISADVSEPPQETGLAVLELNPRPWLRVFRATCAWRQIDRRVFEIGCPVGHQSIPVLLFDGSAAAGRLQAELETRLGCGPLVVGSWCEGSVAKERAQVRIGGEPVAWVGGEESREAAGEVVLSDGRVEVALLNLAPWSWQAEGFPCHGCRVGVLTSGEELLAQGLLSEWLSVVEGAVLVVAGGAELLAAVRSLVGDRLVAVAEASAALEVLEALLIPDAPV